MLSKGSYIQPSGIPTWKSSGPPNQEPRYVPIPTNTHEPYPPPPKPDCLCPAEALSCMPFACDLLGCTPRYPGPTPRGLPILEATDTRSQDYRGLHPADPHPLCPCHTLSFLAHAHAQHTHTGTHTHNRFRHAPSGNASAMSTLSAYKAHTHPHTNLGTHATPPVSPRTHTRGSRHQALSDTQGQESC